MTDNLPKDDEAARALAYLASTDERYARLVAAVKALEHKGKTAKAMAFLEATGTMAEKEAIANSSSQYKQWTAEYEDTVADMEIIRAKRKRAELTLEVWRSANSNRRQGIQV